MLRSLILGIAHAPAVRRMATGGAGRRVALRFVAGETLDEALEVAREQNERGADVSLDFLGENVTSVEQAHAATEMYRSALDGIEKGALRANVSVKLTQLGLDVDAPLAVANAAVVAHRAMEAGTTMTLDMEDHSYTDRTLDTCRRLADRYPGVVGVAVQSYLRRTPQDLASLVEARVPVRLCKGAYKEPGSVAHTRRADVDAAFAAQAGTLIRSEAYPMIATHDERLVRFAIKQITRAERDPSTLEFQMLYGVRRDLQSRLLDQGFRVRVYVPFGTEWYAYLMRRIAERPANVKFFLEALLRG